MAQLYVKGVMVRDKRRMGTKFNRNEDQQCLCCKEWKPFVRRYWTTSLYVTCRQCVYQLESNIKPADIQVYRVKRRS
jgi:hypothetical protein